MFEQHWELKLVAWRQFSAKKSKLPLLSRIEENLSLTIYRTIKHLLPMFLNMLKDEFPDVRLNIISKLELVNNGMSFTYIRNSI
jgi:hypothetical protein